MRTITVGNRQTIVDIAVQYYGSAASVIDLCQDNDLELDAELSPGQTLLIEGTYPASANGDVADYIQANSIVVLSSRRITTVNGNIIVTNDGYIIITNDGDGISFNDANYISDNDSDTFSDNDNNSLIL